MGFFSFKCKKCDHPLLSQWAVAPERETSPINKWMVEAVVVRKDGQVFKGSYDGYGRIDEYELGWGGDMRSTEDCYHEDCWEASGRPKEFRGGSDDADDQGFFFGDEHDIKSPMEGK